MKKIISTFLVSIFGGLLALTIHNYFYDHEVSYENKEKDNVVNIAYKNGKKERKLFYGRQIIFGQIIGMLLSIIACDCFNVMEDNLRSPANLGS